MNAAVPDFDPPGPPPISRQPTCPGCSPHEHHPFLACSDTCACHVRDPFGVIPDD